MSEGGDEFITRVKSGEKFVTHLGGVEFEKIMDLNFGDFIETSKGEKLYILKPSIVEEILNLKRRTQIVYPKDLGYILLKLDIKPGDRVIDAGIGSGVVSYAIARIVGKHGKVYAYEKREDFIEKAKENLENWGVADLVEIKHRDLSEGVEERNVDAFFLDVPQPWLYIDRVWEALKGGGRFATVVPTTNQVQEALAAIKDSGFIRIEVVENLFRFYKPVPQRLRPYDRMVAHTTYMIFAVKINKK
ncbi:MAG: tRNA (adenine-N1)-methyltransferase [Thermotogaceae bacterium]|nr:tRNA (adenine-N1)-methyltransferase [Thermotogaceae bacterium]